MNAILTIPAGATVLVTSAITVGLHGPLTVVISEPYNHVYTSSRKTVVSYCGDVYRYPGVYTKYRFSKLLDARVCVAGVKYRVADHSDIHVDLGLLGLIHKTGIASVAYTMCTNGLGLLLADDEIVIRPETQYHDTVICLTTRIPKWWFPRLQMICLQTPYVFK